MSKITKETIESIYRKYHNYEYLMKYKDTDPLVCVRRFNDAANREIVGLVASALARGRRETIVRSINELIDGAMGGKPAAFVKDVSYREKRRALVNFKHRFNDGEDIAALLEATNVLIRRYGSLGNCFSDCLTRSSGQFKGALALFVDEINKGALTNDGVFRPGFVPSPSSGSACKRLALYLRWMVRKDGIDLGVWKDVPASILVIPVDTHVAKIAKHYELTGRTTSVGWKMAEEITAALRKFDSEDPVRYDFSLCHAGMEDFRAR
jgi:uncharacterized protein (TIGR02757 family)